MSKQNGKKRVQKVSVNQYRKIALFLNPIVLVILVICLFFGAPTPALITIGVIGYGSWLVFLVKANLEDRRIHGKQ